MTRTKVLTLPCTGASCLFVFVTLKLGSVIFAFGSVTVLHTSLLQVWFSWDCPRWTPSHLQREVSSLQEEVATLVSGQYIYITSPWVILQLAVEKSTPFNADINVGQTFTCLYRVEPGMNYFAPCSDTEIESYRYIPCQEKCFKSHKIGEGRCSHHQKQWKIIGILSVLLPFINIPKNRWWVLEQRERKCNM